MAGSPKTIIDVVRAGINAALGNVHTAIPGRVSSYDPITNTATIKPIVKRALYTQDEERVYEEIPEIPNVPIVWPRAGDFVMTAPLSAGDSVLLVFSQWSLAEWRESGELSEPIDARTHSEGWPFAIPGAFPDTSPLSPDPIDLAAREAGMVIGQHGGDNRIEISPLGIGLGKLAVEPVALGPPLVAFITALLPWIADVTSAVGGPFPSLVADGAAAAVAGTAAIAETNATLVRAK